MAVRKSVRTVEDKCSGQKSQSIDSKVDSSEQARPAYPVRRADALHGAADARCWVSHTKPDANQGGGGVERSVADGHVAHRGLQEGECTHERSRRRWPPMWRQRHREATA